MIRFAVGIEGIADLKKDIMNALAKVAKLVK